MSENKYMTASEIGVQNHIVVLPCGEDSESGVTTWTKEALLPYQSYLEYGHVVDRLFKGLIFNSVSGRENHFLNPMYADFGNLAEKKDWDMALRRLFSKDCNFDAAAFNTHHGTKTDIWVTLPYPMQTQTEFGKVKDHDLNFRVEQYRFSALKWWIKKFLKKWERSSHLHEKLSFKGFVWPRASIDSGDEDLVQKVTAYIRNNGLLSLWLQQYGSAGCIKWKEYGFDASCTHPNFYGKTWPDYTWIPNTTVFAKYYHVGMQIVFGKGVLYQDNHLQDYLNYGVYNEYMNDSLLVYQFPNQKMQDIYINNPQDYKRLYSFIKGAYQPVYPTAAFPS